MQCNTIDFEKRDHGAWPIDRGSYRKGEAEGRDVSFDKDVADETVGNSRLIRGAGAPDATDIDEPTHRGDILAATLCLACGIAGYFLVIPESVYVPKSFAGTANSPAFLPNAVCILLSVLGAVYLAKSIVAYRRSEPQPPSRPKDWLLAGTMTAICIAYVAGILLFGLNFASAICVAVTMAFFGERRGVVLLAYAVILPGLLWYFFAKIAIILLPDPVFQILGPFSALEFLGPVSDGVVQPAQWLVGGIA